MVEKALILIPLKSTSKRLPEKNFKFLYNKKLYQYVLDEALKFTINNDIVLSIDKYDSSFNMYTSNFLSSIILDDLNYNKYKVSFIYRSIELIDNLKATIDDVISEVLIFINQSYKILILLQADFPFITVEDIKACYDLFISSGRRTVQSVTKYESGKSPFFALLKDSDGTLTPAYPANSNRIKLMKKDFHNTYWFNGAVTVIDIDRFKKDGTRHSNSAIGYEMPVERSIDVDTLFDFRVAELLIKEKYL